MLVHSLFERAKVPREILEFLVECAIRKERAGEARIAEQVLGIPAKDFHPYQNANVRVQVRNLRLKLEAYYLANPEARVRFRIAGYEVVIDAEENIPSDAKRTLNQARFLADSRFQVDLLHAVGQTERVLKQHPSWGSAWETLNLLRVSLAAHGGGSPKENLRLAGEAADRAVELSPGSGSAHAGQASVAAFLHWDWARAEQLYEKAQLLDPGVRHQSWRLAYLNSLGRSDLAVRAIEEHLCLEERPAMSMQTNLGISLYLNRRVADAERELKRAHLLDPNEWSCLAWLALLHWHGGNRALAVYYQSKAALVARRSPPSSYFEMSNEGLVGAAPGVGHQPGGIGDLGAILSATILHQWNRAADAMERMLDQRYPLALFIPHTPHFDPLWRTSRFRDLVASIGLPSLRAPQP